MKMKQMLKALWKDEEGLTTVEYAIAGGLVAAGVVTAALRPRRGSSPGAYGRRKKRRPRAP